MSRRLELILCLFFLTSLLSPFRYLSCSPVENIQLNVLNDNPIWGPVLDVQTNGLNSDPVTEMNSFGNALAAWEHSDGSDTVVQASFFNGSTWTVPINLTSAGIATNIHVVYNNAGIGFCIWQLNVGSNTSVQVAYFNGSSWQPATSLSTNGNLPTIALNDNGIAFAAWTSTNGNNEEINISKFDGSWSAPFLLTSSRLISSPVITINQKNHALLITQVTQASSDPQLFYFDGTSWIESSPPGFQGFYQAVPLLNDSDKGAVIGVLISSSPPLIYAIQFDGTSWHSLEQISTSVLWNDFADAGINSDGTIIATWRAYEAPNEPRYPQVALYDGNSWSAPETIDIENNGYEPHVRIYNSGQAVATWRGLDGMSSPWHIRTAMYKDGQWESPINLSYNDLFARDGFLTINQKGQALAIWVDQYSGTHTLIRARLFAAFDPPPVDLLKVSASIAKNRFATQTDRVKIIQWELATSGAIVYYQIFRNGELIATISSNEPLRYEDHRRKREKKDTYTVIGTRADGAQISASTEI